MNLHVKIIDAKALPTTDSHGKSDPYVVFSIRERKEQLKTKPISGTNDPVWNEEFTIAVLSVGTEILNFKVFDKDIAADDEIGGFDIQIYKLPPGQIVDAQYPLTAPKTKKPAGSLHLHLQLAPSIIPKWQPVPFVLQGVRLQVVEAKNLASMDSIGKSDPFVIITLRNSPVKFETLVKDNTLDPVWNEAYEILVTDPMNDTLDFLVKDKDIARDDDIGTLVLKLSDIKGRVDQWYPLVPAKGITKAGEIHLITDVHPAPQDVTPATPGLIGK
jgi:Ca2+-dependent lipid-binding protein